MKLTILAPYTTTDKMTGGADRHIQNLIASLSKFSDLEIHVVSSPKRVKRTEVHTDRNITFHQLKSNRLPRTITGITSDAYKIVKEVKKIRPDIVHGQMVGAPYGLATMRLSGKYPTILTVHTLMSQTSKATYLIAGRIHDTIWKFLEFWEIRKIPSFIVVSPHLKKELIRKGARKLRVIPNGVEKSWFDLSSKEIEGRILFVGRVKPVKGHEYLLKAIKKIKDEGKCVELHVVGSIYDKNYFRKLRLLVEKLEIRKNVEYLGIVSDNTLKKEYAECSIFCLPSQEESHPIVLLEAMAAGKPIVATNVGSVSEMIGEGNGFLVEYGDALSLSDKIMELLDNEELRRDMGKSGREYAKEFDWDKIAKRTYNLYQEIIRHYSKKEKDVL